jgi:catechol-2,3-dioxygenase
MPIQRVEGLTYGVEDVAAGTKFFEDLGLEKVESGAKGATFRTPTNQSIHVRPMTDASLPSAPESGPTMREALWGVDSKASLEAIGAELSKDREVKRTPDGAIHSRDDSGFAIAFAVADPKPAEAQALRYNAYESSGRVNERIAHRKALKPTRIGHVVYLIPNDDQKHRRSEFYLERLGFKLTDRAKRVGDFMRVGGVADHHSLLMMWVRQKPLKFDHAALEVPHFDDVLASGELMKQRGWKPVWGPGRQSLGSHVFWHFENPCGGEIELFTDMDRFDDSWVAKVWEDATPGGVWSVGDPPAFVQQGRGGPPQH